jgi:16S rRNA (guanine(966)-N(2))-methyltransferase RsmD
MRVIAGSAKGHHLRSVSGYRTRPTSDRVRGALFNMLGQHLPGVSFLDLFAGSGAVGIEALSRGADTCVFVDSSREACGIIRQNLMATGLSARSEVHCKVVAASLDIAARLGRVFDLVYIDPPYDTGLALRTLEMMNTRPVVSPSGVVVVEHSRRENLPNRLDNLTLVRSETYGDTTLSFFKRDTKAEPGGEAQE